jgi:hypothetical protein
MTKSVLIHYVVIRLHGIRSDFPDVQVIHFVVLEADDFYESACTLVIEARALRIRSASL